MGQPTWEKKIVARLRVAVNAARRVVHVERCGRCLFRLTLIAAGSVLLSACRSDPPPPSPTPEVTVAPARQGPVTDWSEFTGQFSAVQSVEVRPRVSGYVMRVPFREGADVHQGDTLFLIDPRPYDAVLTTAQAQLARAQSAVQLATTEASRAETLFVARALAREEFETRTNALAQARADLRGAHAAVDTATLNMEWTAVRAPIGGRVSRAAVTAGNYVQGGTSIPPLTTIVSQDPIYVYFNADEQSYLALTAAGTSASRSGTSGQTVLIGLANEVGFPHHGRIDFIDNQLDGTTGTIRVRAVVDNHDRRLTPGLFARVQLAGGPSHDATLVEDRAIGTDQDKRYVYVVKPESTVDYRPVQLGPLHDGLRIITSGIQPGERVIVDGLQRVHPGGKVVAQLEPGVDSTASRNSIGAPHGATATDTAVTAR